MNTNLRSSSYGMDKPLVDGRPHTSRDVSVGLLGLHANGGVTLPGGFAGGLYNNGVGGVTPGLGGMSMGGLETSASTPMFGANGQNGYFTSPTAGMIGFNGGAMMGYQPQQPAMSPMVYQPLGAPSAYGFPAMNGGYAFGAPAQAPYGAGSMGMPNGAVPMMEEPFDAKKRAGIDRWRMSVAPEA